MSLLSELSALLSLVASILGLRPRLVFHGAPSALKSIKNIELERQGRVKICYENTVSCRTRRSLNGPWKGLKRLAPGECSEPGDRILQYERAPARGDRFGIGMNSFALSWLIHYPISYSHGFAFTHPGLFSIAPPERSIISYTANSTFREIKSMSAKH